jgi:hypothetical protein
MPQGRNRWWLVLLGSACLFQSNLPADTVTEWNAYTEQAIHAAGQPPAVQARFLAIVHVAIFDAVNGLENKYTPFFVTERGPRAASPAAAAAQAAYTALVQLFPDRKAVLDSELAASLGAIARSRPGAASLERGRAWGAYVAGQILAWRSQDGFTNKVSANFGGNSPGIWRSIPEGTNADGALPAYFRQLAFMVPFALQATDQFRPGPPPALSSALYAVDVNEVKVLGGMDSTRRTPDQTRLALLWQAVGPADENHALRPLLESTDRRRDLVDTARVLALINIAAADATIAVFDCKNTYDFWRPYHAIRLADTDGNPATTADPNWESSVVVKNFQEYMSYQTASTAALLGTAAELMGDDGRFTLSSPDDVGFTWTFHRFSDAVAQVIEARIWGGLHFRNSCNVGAIQGTKISRYLLGHFLLPLRAGGGEPMDFERASHSTGESEIR